MRDSRDSLRERVGNYLEQYSDLYHRRPTRYDTGQVLGEFESFLAARARRAPRMRDVKRGDVTEYMRHKVGQGRAAATANRHVRTVRAFFRWCVAQELAKSDPCRGVRPLKVTRRRQPLPQLDQVRRLLDHLRVTRDVLYSSLVQVAANTGLRLGELVNLRPEDVGLSDRLLFVRNDAGHSTKDNAERYVPLNVRALQILRFWVSLRAEDPGEGLFFKRPPRARSWLWRALNQRVRAAGAAGVTWQGLRHLFATTLARYVPEMVLAAILGHSDPRTTRRWYVHLAASSLEVPPVVI